MSPRLTASCSAVQQFLCTNFGTTSPLPGKCSSAAIRNIGQPSCACLPAPGTQPSAFSASSATSAHLTDIQTPLA